MDSKTVLFMFTILICSSFSKWNLILVQPLEELHTVLHMVSHLPTESTNAVWDFPLLMSLII
jgi:hypothetical protein